MTNKANVYKNLPIQTNIQSAPGLVKTTISTPEHPLNVHDGLVASMAASIPIAPTMSLTTAEQLIKQTKVAAASGDLFLTGRDLSIESFVLSFIEIRLGHWTRREESLETGTIEI